MSLSEEYFELERERLKTENEIRSHLNKSTSSERYQIHSLDKNLSDNLHNQKKLEDELSNWERKNKNVKEELYEKEYKINRLVKDCENYQEQLKRLKVRFEASMSLDDNIGLRNDSYIQDKYASYDREISLENKNTKDFG